MTLHRIVQEKASRAIRSAFDLDLQAEITQSTQEQFGHYQCNSALKIAKTLKINPRQAAEKIANAIEKEGIISKIEVAGPGFINITLDTAFLASQVSGMLVHPHLGISLPQHPKKVIVEFSSPNVAKELHVGHLRGSIIGDCLARVFEFLGENVLRLNHIGDWGTQFGMLITFITEKDPQILTGEKSTDLSCLNRYYQQSKALFDADPEFKKRAQLKVVALQGGDSDALKAWQVICEISRKAYQQIYDILDVKISERGESFYNPFLKDIISDLEKKGLITLSGGAKCVFMEGFTNQEGEPLPMIVQKSDGGFNYDTTDMAAMRHRIDVEKADRIIILTDAGQKLHFEMIVKASELAGYLKGSEVNHVTFGVVLGPDGKRVKTRSGQSEKLIDLLTEAVAEAKAVVKERLPDLSEKELSELSHAIGIGAVKYADLSTHRTKDYLFSYEKMLRFEGNTAVFLLYAYVRIEGIKRKVKKDVKELIGVGEVVLAHPSEIALALKVRQFDETLEAVARELLPNRLTDYLYDLAEKFNAFFRDCRVEGTEHENSRLLLAEVVARVLKTGLHLLGIKTVERM